MNALKALRMKMLVSKAELARKAGVSSLTIDRIEAGGGSRMDTRRKILAALGVPVERAQEVFPVSDSSTPSAAPSDT